MTEIPTPDDAVRDIAKLMKVEETLAEERTLLQIVLDNLTGYVYARDASGRYILDNPAHRQFLGVASHEDVTGKTVFDFFPTEIAQQYHADDLEIIRSGKSLLNQEEVTVTISGEKRWLSTTKVPFRNTKGEIAGLVCMSRDITEEKELQDNLKKLLEILKNDIRQHSGGKIATDPPLQSEAT